jgi:transposase InsO family protein
MQMVLCDGKKFRAGAARLRRVALFFLDDCTRFGLHVVVGTEENTELFLRGLYGLLKRYGFMGLLYLDGGPGFASLDTAAVLGQLLVPLIHGAARYPEGHGKIERFNRTAKSDLLRSVDGAADVDPSIGSLELRFGHFLELYNDRPHEELDKDTPRMRWDADERALRFPEDEPSSL